MKKNIKVQYSSRMTGGGYYESRYTTYTTLLHLLALWEKFSEWTTLIP